ncbi:hypothetical protein A9G12_02945 [Gilliamella sp. wkB112]|nr:hypothetical protein A9G12_02945 [Gilliamella apicola]
MYPSNSPENLKKRMLATIAAFDNQDEVLFLVDLWGEVHPLIKRIIYVVCIAIGQELLLNF